MKYYLPSLTALLLLSQLTWAQQQITFIKNNKSIAILANGKPFTTFMFPDTLEKPILYPVYTSSQTLVTRGFPFQKRDGEPTDHPHHMGIWFNFENVNGLDFWNNSYAIPSNQKSKYGWIKTISATTEKKGKNGILNYQARWTDQKNATLLTENTVLTFSAAGENRTIDRTTTLTADQDVTFTDAKDGLLGFRLAQELQIPSKEEKQFTDDKGNVTTVKSDNVQRANGNYLSSIGKMGDDVWSSRAKWCKVFGKMGEDSVSVTIIDYPKNVNYPTYWHARGYGLFAANPLGEKVFTNGKSSTNLKLAKGESVTFKYRIVIQEGKTTLNAIKIEELAAQFGKQ